MTATRRFTSFAFALALASTATAVAQDRPVATFMAPGRSAVHETIVLDARGSKSEAPLEWFIDGPKEFGKTAPEVKGEMGLIVDPPKGTYRVFLIAADSSGKKDMDFRTIEVVDAPPKPAGMAPEPAPKAVLKLPQQLVAGSHIVLDASKSRSAGPIVWKVEGPRDLVASFSPDSKDGPQASIAVIFNAPAGHYAVTATAVGADGTDPDTTEPVGFHVDEAASPAPDLPTPTTITGYTGRISAVLLVDLDDVPRTHTHVVAKDNVAAYLKDGNFTYKVMDVRSSDFSGSAYDQYLRGGFRDRITGKVAPKVATPALVLNDEKGAFIACDPAPSNPQHIVVKVNQLRAKMGTGW